MITVLEFLFSIEFCVCNRFPLAFTSIDRTETINLVFIQTKPNEMENLSRIHPPSRDCDRACCETVLLPQSLSNLITCRLGLGHEQHRYRFGETWAAIYSIPASGWQQWQIKGPFMTRLPPYSATEPYPVARTWRLRLPRRFCDILQSSRRPRTPRKWTSSWHRPQRQQKKPIGVKSVSIKGKVMARFEYFSGVPLFFSRCSVLAIFCL